MKRLLILLILLCFVPPCQAQCTEETPCPEVARLSPAIVGGGVPVEGVEVLKQEINIDGTTSMNLGAGNYRVGSTFQASSSYTVTKADIFTTPYGSPTAANYWAVIRNVTFSGDPLAATIGNIVTNGTSSPFVTIGSGVYSDALYPSGSRPTLTSGEWYYIGVETTTYSITNYVQLKVNLAVESNERMEVWRYTTAWSAYDTNGAQLRCELYGY